MNPSPPSSRRPPFEDGARERRRFGAAVAVSSSMHAVFDLLASEAVESSPLLLLGEAGVGKQLLARALWTKGRYAAGPFIVIDGASRDLDSLAREFDSETDALPAFERARGGVLYLRNVDELPIVAQEAIGRYLSERARRAAIGGARLVASSRRDLVRETDAGRFSALLSRELCATVIAIPALRTRSEDVACIASFTLQQLGVPTTLLDAGAPTLREALEAHDWPGNVRELTQVVESIARVKGMGAEESNIPRLSPHDGGGLLRFDPTKSFGELRKEQENAFEQSYIDWLLSRHRGNLSRAAREARMDRKHLRDLARRHGLLDQESEADDARPSETRRAESDSTDTPPDGGTV